MTLRLAVQSRLAAAQLRRAATDPALQAELAELERTAREAEAAVRANTLTAAQGRALADGNDRLRTIFDGLHGGDVAMARKVARDFHAAGGDTRGFGARFRPSRGWLRFFRDEVFRR